MLRDSVMLQGVADGVVFFRENKTEPYVEIPPAYIITDSDGATWTFGDKYIQRGHVFEFSVVRNGIDTGELASKIVYQKGRVSIFGVDGWRHFSRGRRHFI
jgi:hypothetical protein